MATSDYTLNLLKKFEGYTAKPKWDHKQYSVGYSTRWEPGQPIGTREDHERRLREEAGEIDSYIDKNITVPLDENKRAALTSFGYNLGPGGIEKLLPDINSGNWDRVAQRMLSFSRAGDNPNALIDRRREEAGILLGAPLPDGAPSSGGSSASPQEGDMFNLMAALGSGNLLQGLGKGLGMGNVAAAGDQSSIFGSLGALFGQGGDGGGGGGGGQSANPAGDANMKLAQNAMASAGGEDEKLPVYDRKPVDLSNLMKIIQQRSQLGIGGRAPGPGLGA